jgi:hypothetical protein
MDSERNTRWMRIKVARLTLFVKLDVKYEEEFFQGKLLRDGYFFKF